ncbi:hypothetical protein [Sphingosinicella sp. YJ22]|uniref:hypothetical protein n=1 Tax=Sphingosinicella sp. YJ22 TaxID=1104780 RepID=UPI00140D8513|nr:hypothetical protein [Sphingosinicella sp. YJ22]
MRTRLSLLSLLLLAACATPPRPYAPVDNVRYSAIGTDPFWMVTIGDDRIVLRLGQEGQEARDIVYPRTLPVTQGDLTRWQSGDGTQVITVEARRMTAACERSGRRYEDHVRVMLSGRMLDGCGGRLLR